MRQLAIVLSFSFLLTILGCASHKEVSSLEHIRTEYIHQRDTILSHDSVHVHDSVFLTQRGDTFFQYKYRTEYRDRLVYRTHNDTVQHTDTIVKNVVITKEKQLSLLQRITSAIGTIALCLLAAAVLVFILRRVIK